MPSKEILSGGSKHNAATSLVRRAEISLDGEADALGNSTQPKDPEGLGGWVRAFETPLAGWVRDQSATR